MFQANYTVENNTVYHARKQYLVNTKYLWQDNTLMKKHAETTFGKWISSRGLFTWIYQNTH